MLAFLLTISTITFTPNSKSSVKIDGILPGEAKVLYEQTGNGKNGQTTAGNTTTLTINDLKNVYLEKATLYMHSNKASGAGALHISTNNSVLYELADATFQDWTGAYSSSSVPINYHPQNPILFAGERNQLMIQIQGSENSLYVDSYVLTFSQVPPQQFSVHFVTGTSYTVETLLETEMGSGVILPPCLDASNDWRFVGWSMTQVRDIITFDEKPAVYASGTTFHPLENTIFYALYEQGEASVWRAAEMNNTTGYFLLTSPFWKVMASTPEGTRLRTFSHETIEIEPNEWTNPIWDYDIRAVFEMNIQPDSILIQHYETKQFIGAPTSISGSINKNAHPWNYYINGNNQVVIYKAFGTDTLSLMAYPGTGLEEVEMVFFSVKKNMVNRRANVLFNIYDMPADNTMFYTSCPPITALPSLMTDDEDAMWYDLLGRPVRYINQRGIYVRRGKVKIVW